MRKADLELGLDVQQILNSTIRPLLNVDAGDAEVTEVVAGHVTITLLGSCSRCLFRASCAVYTVVDRLEEQLAGRGASFAVTGVPSAARPAPPRPDPLRPAPPRPDPLRPAPPRPDPLRPDPLRPAPPRPDPLPAAGERP
jgi:Fe-S cluster biogenesis protein NfuA